MQGSYLFLSKAILIGDPNQLPSVGAGGLFAEIAERLGAAELHANRRQLDLIEHDLLEAVRNGDPLDYLSHDIKTGWLVVATDLDDAKAALVADWWRASLEHLAARLLAFQDHYSQIAQPFAWTFTRADLDRLIERIEHREPLPRLAA